MNRPIVQQITDPEVIPLWLADIRALPLPTEADLAERPRLAARVGVWRRVWNVLTGNRRSRT